MDFIRTFSLVITSDSIHWLFILTINCKLELLVIRTLGLDRRPIWEKYMIYFGNRETFGLWARKMVPLSRPLHQGHHYDDNSAFKPIVNVELENWSVTREQDFNYVTSYWGKLLWNYCSNCFFYFKHSLTNYFRRWKSYQMWNIAPYFTKWRYCKRSIRNAGEAQYNFTVILSHHLA